MTNAIAKIQKKLQRILPILLVGLLLISGPDFFKNDKPVGERVAEQQHEISAKSERPKTTGEFLDEARGDVPIDKRIDNIARDSAEAFSQFGQGIANSVKESAKEVGGNITGK